ncbi:TetR/AcrR family transcriptional regulator [Gordonia sp. ABSL1-1]|uniref:TetR/AcrR family transcriptional regulator n=1 Tax=Gordonia sp. ABSL1-1 TaxID=3053923 RepID=UPI002572E310|nr:TetR/AcrR family transcriptional regulator [Gordonia sp. ABSL1-1]MDL9936207.1 TetR/AcrR family transcriptional regulator [Gordonia sp. ABSL1-1]
MTENRPYATLLAKGEERRQLILDLAGRRLVRQGWRNTTLAQIAADAGVSPAGILHHFDSKEHLLHAVIDARDHADLAEADLNGDLLVQIRRVAERIQRSPELVGVFTVLLVENLSVDAPLHDRLVQRWRTAVDIVAEVIQANQQIGVYRADLDAYVTATEIVAFINGVEMSWLLDPEIPLTEVFESYVRKLENDMVIQGEEK